jgi:hypothetical protein
MQGSGKCPFVSSWNTALNYQSALKRGIYCNIRGCPGGAYEDYCLLECETVEIITVSEESTASTFRVLVPGTYFIFPQLLVNSHQVVYVTYEAHSSKC